MKAIAKVKDKFLLNIDQWMNIPFADSNFQKVSRLKEELDTDGTSQAIKYLAERLDHI